VVRNSSSSIKPNRDLSTTEREAKRALQSQVKELKLLIYWQRRIAFAIKCKDDVKLQLAQDELLLLRAACRQQRQLLLSVDDDDDDDEQQQPQQQQQQQHQQRDAVKTDHRKRNHIAAASSSSQEDRANKFIEAVYEELIRPNVSKGRRADTSLLKHMRKGTQKRSMFDNVDAIWGYTLCKFCKRAMYVVSSLSKLAPPPPPPPTAIATPTRSNNVLAKDGCSTSHYGEGSLWNRLLAVSTVCCIGSGPGSDAVGFLSFLITYGKICHEDDDDDDENGHINEPPCLKRVLFLDFAMQQWKVVTDQLESILVPRHVQQLDMDFCDVTVSNSSALRMLHASGNGERTLFVDLFLVSFLLTETHGHWEAFVLELIDLANRNALFYFAEPRPWQLHRLVELCQGKLDFVWIDSSMNNPSLQSLGTRVGPAILLGIKL
jgi:hypothetical protein